MPTSKFEKLDDFKKNYKKKEYIVIKNKKYVKKLDRMSWTKNDWK